MLVSEILGWYYIISWDNPVPADSSAMLKALKALGRVTPLQTKTSVALAPKSTTSWRDVRSAIKQNIDSKKGNAYYVNIRSGKGFHIGTKSKRAWKKVT